MILPIVIYFVFTIGYVVLFFHSIITLAPVVDKHPLYFPLMFVIAIIVCFGINQLGGMVIYAAMFAFLR